MSRESIAKLILDSIESGKQESKKTVMGQAFFEVVYKHKEIEDDVELTEEDRKVVEKIKFLRTCEDAADLAWMEYSSWNLFSPDFKEVFHREVDPLEWGALYFQYSRLGIFENVLWRMLIPGHSLYDLCCGNVHKFVYIGPESSAYDQLNPTNFKTEVETFNRRMVRAIGFQNNQVCVKEFSGGK